MEIIVPAAGLSTRFAGMKPKYLLYDYKGDLMLRNAIYPFLGKHNITIGILKEHEEKYQASEFIKHEFEDLVKVVIIDKPTRGPADTVYQILKQMAIPDSAFLIKDCDSFFDHEIIPGNYVCVSSISEHEVLKKLASKSFTVANEHDIINHIVEKRVVSDTFCVGGYKFASTIQFMASFQILNTDREVFVSDVIAHMLSFGEIFVNQKVQNYIDVGTSDDWFEYNDRPVIFCDIDGTLVKAQSRLDLIDKKPYEPLENNVKRMLKMQEKGAQIIFVTARESVYRPQTREMLYDLGFKSFSYLDGLQNASRILINDYNNSNPHPRAIAINIKRDSDNLGDFL
jgi:hydroxymethylpyrimidine pyrophosphatase-like HAD family hydrolase